MADIAGHSKLLWMGPVGNDITDGRFPPNQKQKYDENLIFQFTTIDFLFAFLYIIGSISALDDPT